MLACQMGCTKFCPTIVWNKIFENITADKIDMTTALYFEIYSLLLSQLPFSSSFVSVNFVFCTFSSCIQVTHSNLELTISQHVRKKESSKL